MPTWDWMNSGSVAGKQTRFATLAVLSSETLGPLCFFPSLLGDRLPHMCLCVFMPEWASAEQLIGQMAHVVIGG